MTRVVYILPGESEVTRTFTHDEMARDMYDILIAGEVVATVNFKTARGYWMGRIKLAEILDQQQKQPGEKV